MRIITTSKSTRTNIQPISETASQTVILLEINWKAFLKILDPKRNWIIKKMLISIMTQSIAKAIIASTQEAILGIFKDTLVI